MKTPEDVDQIPVGLGKKVEKFKKPEPKWRYLGADMWQDKDGRKCYAPPKPPNPTEDLWKLFGIPNG